MENKESGFFHSPTWYFIVAMVSAALVLVTSKIHIVTYARPYMSLTINLRWIFWLALAISLVSFMQLLKLLMYAMHERHRLPLFLAWPFEERFITRYERTSHRFQSILHNRIGRLILAGIGIFVVTSILWQTKAIHADETSAHCYRLIDALKGSPVVQPDRGTVDLLTFLTGDNSNYYKKRIQLVRDLKKAGAKAVLMKMAELQAPGDELRYLRELEETNIVVFASDYPRRFRVKDSLGEFSLTFGSETLDQKTLDETGDLARIRPAKSDSPDIPYDITLELLRKYNGYSPDLVARGSGDNLEFGKYRIPVTGEGWMYSRNTDNWLTGDAFVYIDTSGMRKYNSPGGPKFFRDYYSPGLKVISNWSRPAEEIGNQLQGKIVILDEGGYFYTPRSYEMMVENILSNNLITKSGSGHLWLSFACLIIAGSFAYRFRWTIAIPSMFILGLLTVLFGSSLYDNFNYLIDIFYPLLSVAIAMATFPFIAMRSED